jgi:hypothetical protein
MDEYDAEVEVEVEVSPELQRAWDDREALIATRTALYAALEVNDRALDAASDRIMELVRAEFGSQATR